MFCGVFLHKRPDVLVDPASGRDESAALLLGAVEDILDEASEGVLVPVLVLIHEASVYGRGVWSRQDLVFIGGN